MAQIIDRVVARPTAIGHVPGGQAFVNKFVEDACRWTQFVREPVFIIQTQWYTEEVGDMYRSMGLQWQPQEQRWMVISAPCRLVPLSDLLSGNGQQDNQDNDGVNDDNNDLRKRVVCFDKNDPKRLCYHVNSDEDLVEMLRATFELELWTSGQEMKGDMYFECEPKLFTVYHTGQLKRVFCNIYTFADSILAWEEMCRCYLKIIKVLTGKTMNDTPNPDDVDQKCDAGEPESKRQKVSEK